MVFDRWTPEYESSREDIKILTFKVNFLCQKLYESFQLPWHTQILADQLTLFQPGGQIMPT